MSVVIVGGNECMERRYKELCESYDCKAKVYIKVTGSIKGIGSPDLLVLFIGTMSHKMLHSVLCCTKDRVKRVVRCPQSSVSALKQVLEQHGKGRCGTCLRSFSYAMRRPPLRG